MPERLFIGVDGGATNCRARIADAAGNVMGEARLRSPANIAARKPAVVAKLILRAVRQAARGSRHSRSAMEERQRRHGACRRRCEKRGAGAEAGVQGARLLSQGGCADRRLRDMARRFSRRRWRDPDPRHRLLRTCRRRRQRELCQRLRLADLRRGERAMDRPDGDPPFALGARWPRRQHPARRGDPRPIRGQPGEDRDLRQRKRPPPISASLRRSSSTMRSVAIPSRARSSPTRRPTRR